jgi:chromosome segregation ATPase
MNCEEVSYDPCFLKKKIFQIQEENSQLKSDLIHLENQIIPKLKELEDELYKCKKDNINLCFEIDKREQKITELTNKTVIIEKYNKDLSEKNKQLENDNLNLNEKLNFLNKEIKINKNINDKMRIDNENFSNIIQQNNYQINQIKEENNILVSQLNELQENLNNVISPKLKMNEENFLTVQKEVEKLLIENSNLKNNNIVLINENKNQKEIISNLKTKIKTYLNQGQNIFNKNFEFMKDSNTNKEKPCDLYFNYYYTEPKRDIPFTQGNYNFTGIESTYQNTK